MENGRILHLDEVPPCTVAREVRRAVTQWTWRYVGHNLQIPSLASGGFMEGIHRFLRPYGNTSLALQSSLLSIVTGAIPTTAQVLAIQDQGSDAVAHVAEEPAEQTVCHICLQRITDHYTHRWWDCTLTWDLRHQYGCPHGLFSASTETV